MIEPIGYANSFETAWHALIREGETAVIVFFDSIFLAMKSAFFISAFDSVAFMQLSTSANIFLFLNGT
jgi:hypothetical protein